MNDKMANLAKSYDMLEEKYHDILDSHHHLERELNEMRQKRDCMAVAKCVREERIAALEAALREIDNYCYDMNDVDHADFEKMRVRIAKLEAAIKQILWKLNRKENTSSYHNGVKITTPCTWAKIDINDACLNEAKALVGGEG
jgi:ribosomal 50S subunit-associated protein YjgA (DUF615 family)